ncbi:dihydroorotate dehydrogenase (fumarate) [Malonomonas rubra DSM 5091]|uniref:Dihydroorotate dehydrogenase (Fumarate) n=1 Tax=Malonomonas rubra DSM 5091 TaxID=1122189 RepID=A0A1M6CGC4_MALRU|nr:dihydroorotate dehydrogenase-like protein [Malonomonas rubra]SHI59973.1 dihydroorotate dehydrogenase (fumarate) [Malonomonas rubra DSM 5091]
MADLSTTYMGIPLRNPFIVASSSLTKTLDGVRRCAEAGAGAVVLKSLFEEQIAAETSELSKHADDYSGYGEAYHYIQGYGMDLGPKDYLQLIVDAKKELDIPIIASLNCISTERWAEYAGQLEKAGADAIELNVGLMPTLAKEEGPTIVDQHLRILHSVKSRVKIPVAMKVGPYFTSFANIADRLTRDRAEAPAYSVGWFGKNKDVGKITWHGADALVIFNRFYKFDIDIDKLELVHGNPYSTQQEIHYTLRWLSLLNGKIPADLCASTGIHNGRDVIKALLAGAKVTQLCSSLYLNGVEQISQIEAEVKDWMQVQGFQELSDFRGKMSQINSENPSDYERLQYIKLFVGVE